MTIEDFNVIIAGGRDFSDYERLKETANHLLKRKISEGYKINIVCGMAKGADLLGYRYAKEVGFCVLEFPAQWDLYDKSAGYKRNEEMAKVALACICFWDGKSRGTKHMIDIAKRHGLKLVVEEY